MRPWEVSKSIKSANRQGALPALLLDSKYGRVRYLQSVATRRIWDMTSTRALPLATFDLAGG